MVCIIGTTGTQSSSALPLATCLTQIASPMPMGDCLQQNPSSQLAFVEPPGPGSSRSALRRIMFSLSYGMRPHFIRPSTSETPSLFICDPRSAARSSRGLPLGDVSSQFVLPTTSLQPLTCIAKCKEQWPVILCSSSGSLGRAINVPSSSSLHIWITVQ